MHILHTHTHRVSSLYCQSPSMNSWLLTICNTWKLKKLVQTIPGYMCMMIIHIAPIVTMTSRILSSDTQKNIIDPIKPYSAFISWYRIVSGFQWNKTCYSVETCLIPIPPPPILAASNFDPFFFLDTSRHDLGSPKCGCPGRRCKL